MKPVRSKRKIFIVDDHPIFREGLTQSINRQPDLIVCGEAESAAQAMEALGRLKPDLLIVDITLPGKSGLELVKDLRAIHPELRLLAVSMHDESLYASRLLRAGARGYVMKQENPQKLIHAIHHVLEGGIYVSERMSAQILENFSNPTASHISPIEQLTDREFEILHLIGQGRNKREISEQLHLSSKTIAMYQINIRRKLNLTSSSDVIRFAVRWEAAQDP